MNPGKLIYWASTVAICLIMCYSASMYFSNTEMVEGFFRRFNYPDYLVIPLAVAKILAVIMILWRKIPWVTEWAYAGLFFDLVLAFFAHERLGDSVTFVLLAAIALLTSYFFGKYYR